MNTISILPQIKSIPKKKLMGKRITMNFIHNKTFELWKSFMPKRHEIKNKVNSNLISLRVYDESYSFKNFNPEANFEKWATMEVSGFYDLPPEMETYTIPSGLYAVFNYKGLNTDTSIYEYIYGEWLQTNLQYDLDNRPHFEVMGEKYKNNDPDSEEEIWIPIKTKN